MKKVLISRKNLKNTMSGVPKKVLQEICFFQNNNYKVYAIAEDINKKMIEEVKGIPIKTLSFPFSGFLRRKFYQKQVASWIKKNKPDVIIGHGDIIEQDVLFMHNCVHLAHELIYQRPLPKTDEVGSIHAEILQKNKFKLVICNSELMRQDFIKRFKVSAEKAVVIYPEVDTQEFDLSDEEHLRSKWRKKLGLNSDDFVFSLITSGNFKKRNLGLLIETFAQLKDTCPQARLLIAGGGIGPDFIEQVKRLQLDDKVIFAPAIKDVKNYYLAIDVFVLPAFIEEFGRSVLEAMFCKKPVITTDKVGASEIMQGLSRNFILTDLTLAALKMMMKQLKEDQTLYEELSRLNHQLASEFTAEKQNEKFDQILKSFSII